MSACMYHGGRNVWINLCIHVFMCVCVYVFMKEKVRMNVWIARVCACGCVCIRVYIRVHACVDACIYVSVACMCVFAKYACLNKCACGCMSACMRLRAKNVCLSVCVCMSACACIHVGVHVLGCWVRRCLSPWWMRVCMHAYTHWHRV